MKLKHFTKKNFIPWVQSLSESQIFDYQSMSECVFATFLKTVYPKRGYISVNNGGIQIFTKNKVKYYEFSDWQQKLSNQMRTKRMVNKSDVLEFLDLTNQ